MYFKVPLKQVLQLLILLKTFWSGQQPNKIKAMNLAIDQWNHGCRIMIYKCIQHTMKVNLLLLKDLLKP